MTSQLPKVPWIPYRAYSLGTALTCCDSTLLFPINYSKALRPSRMGLVSVTVWCEWQEMAAVLEALTIQEK